MPALIEPLHPGSFLVSEAPGTLSREAITLRENEALEAGAVLGQVLFGDVEAEGAAVAGNTGNGVMTLANPATGAGVKAGVYRLTCIEPATDAGTFQVEDPDGIAIGVAAVGVAFDGAVKFTIADGGTNFVAGDSFTITVEFAAGSEEYGTYDPDATDGRQFVAGILFGAADTSDGPLAAVAIVRQAEVVADNLSWFEGATEQQIAAGLTGLRALTIIPR